MSEISLVGFQKALDTLKIGYKDQPIELERDGLIKRFGYTLELCWKTSKKVLLSNGIEVDTPKNVVRELGNLNWISNPESWIDYIDKRNETSHMYNEDVAIKIFGVIKQFISDAESLLIILDKKKR